MLIYMHSNLNRFCKSITTRYLIIYFYEMLDLNNIHEIHFEDAEYVPYRIQTGLSSLKKLI